MKLNNRTILFAVVLIAITVIAKLLFAPQLAFSGFSPVIAIALFSGMIVKEKNASFILPLVALFVSDIIIEVLHRANLFAFAGFYKGQILNYGFLLLATLVGWFLKGKNYSSLIIAAIAAPTVYFLLSNFSVWFSSQHITYAKTFSGLIACYTAALPFYKNELLATIVFLPAIAFAYNYIVNGKSKLILA